MLFIRTILSLSLATFSLAIPVAQPQAVRDLGDVGTSCLSHYALYTSLIDSTFISGLIGRDNPVFQAIANLVNDYLDPFVSSGLVDQQRTNSFIGKIDVLVDDALSATGDSGLDAGAINSVLQQIETAACIDFNDAVLAGNITQDVVHNLLINVDNFVGQFLEGGSVSA